ncbi:MAG: hypothetical protein KDA32_02490 [Phycisphaerales bacterium]|nr:hypothetical protein [Phycisphaerales bacterium]
MRSFILFAALASCSAIARAGTDTFIDRLDPCDLRVVTFNVLQDGLFPETSQLLADYGDECP